MVPLCNPPGDRTLCRVSMTSRTRENQTHKLLPNLKTSSQDSRGKQPGRKTSRALWRFAALHCGDERIHERGRQVFSVDASVAGLTLGLCSFLNNSRWRSCWCGQLSERNAAHVELRDQRRASTGAKINMQVFRQRSSNIY